MREKNRKIVNNKFSVGRFIVLFIVMEILVVIYYAKKIATFSVNGGRIWSLAVIIAIIAGGSIISSWKTERNWISLISGTLLPIMLYEAVSMWKYIPEMRLLVIAGSGASALIGFLIATKIVKRIHCTSIKQEVVLIKTARVSRILCCMILFVVCIYGNILISSQYTIRYKDIAYSLSEDYNDIPDYSNSLTANIATVAKIDPDGGWASLSIDEKNDVLETIIRVECRYLGMRDSAPSLELAYMEEQLLGKYNHEKDVISLSYNYVIDSGANGYSVMQVLCHELYHRYQEYQVKLLEALEADSSLDRYKNLLVLDTARNYMEEMSNYITPSNSSSLSYLFYSSQHLELDAEKYANAAVADYYSRIQDYLKQI